MTETAATFLGDQLKAFLLNQFATAPGAKHKLGFLGTGIAVDPDSFLSAGQFNPARVNSWINVILDPLGALADDGGYVEGTEWTASVMMQTIASQAKCLAPADSEEQQGFARAKSQAMENLGGSTEVSTAPLDWYDQAKIATWPHCSLATTSSSTSGTTPATPEPTPKSNNVLPDHRLWAWRTLAPLPVADPGPVRPVEIPATKVRAIGLETGFSVSRTMIAATRPVALASPATAFQRAAAVKTFNPGLAATLRDEQKILIERAPVEIVRKDETSIVKVAQATVVSQAIATAANQASTSAVDSDSLSLKLNYLVVALSRAPWWNDLMMVLDNWYIPGLHRGALTECGDPTRVTAMPVALILTSDVAIRSMWSAADRSAASGNTHFGPWVLNSVQFKSVENSSETELTIPGMQAIACIYRELPILPPRSDPGLAPSA